MTAIDVPCVMLRISQKWYQGIDEDTLYDVSRGWWRVGPRREQAEYAVAVAGGVVRGVWVIHDWRPRHLDVDDADESTRWGFDGEPAEDQAHLVGLDVAHLFPQGAANPVRYLNLDEAPLPAEPSWALSSGQARERARSLLTVCDDLMQNIVTHLSLGSKELFHSNFIGRLFELDARVAVAALEPLLVPDSGATLHRVLREPHQLDLVVHLPGYRPVVIENKVFSIPDHDQLDRYAAQNIPAAGLTRATKVLLSMSDPGWRDDQREGWTWLRYDDLANRVHHAVTRHLGHDQFLVEMTNQWRQLVLALLDIGRLTSVLDGDEPMLLDGDTMAALRPTRLGDAFQKLRNEAAAHRLRSHLSAAGLAASVVRTDFGRSVPLIDVHVGLPDGGMVGWQWQGSQWRRFIRVPAKLQGRGDATRRARTEYVRDHHHGWFDFTIEHGLGVYGTAPSEAYKHFAPDFVYDYVRVPALTVAEFLVIAEHCTAAAMAYAAAVDGTSPATTPTTGTL